MSSLLTKKDANEEKKSPPELVLSNDTYAIAFKAMHGGVKKSLDLTEVQRY